MKTSALLCISAILAIGCGGTFEEARRPSVQIGAAPPSPRCISLDDQHALYGGAAKFSAALAGASGLAAIPVKDEKAQLALGISSAVLAGVAVGTAFISDAKATSWARECAAQ